MCTRPAVCILRGSEQSLHSPDSNRYYINQPQRLRIAGVDVCFQTLMAVAADAACACALDLFKAVFPGEVYTRDQDARLAAELRRTAALLDPGVCLR